MGARLSRLSKTSPKPSTPQSPSSQPSTSKTATQKPLDFPVTATLRPSAVDTKRAADDDWAKLLTSISGAISSSTWEGSVGVKTRKGDRDASWHASQQRPEARAKLPRPWLPSAADVSARGTGKLESEALHSIAEALERDAEEVEEERLGRLRQNQLLEFFRLRREDAENWGVAELGARYGLAEGDVKSLIFYSRTAMAKNVYGATRAVADPEKGVLRFEDMKGSNPGDMK